MRAALAAAAIALSTASPAAAADYPFSGFYTTNIDRIAFEKAQLLCAYSFFVQEKTGSFVNYHLDLGGYLRDQSIRYLEYSRGHCYADTGQKIETCIVTSDSDPTQKGKSFVDVYSQISPDMVEVRYFDDANQASAFVRDGTAGDIAVGEYDRCAGFDRATLGPYLSEERSTLSPDERAKVTAPQLDEATTAIMTRVLQAIAKQE